MDPARADLIRVVSSSPSPRRFSATTYEARAMPRAAARNPQARLAPTFRAAAPNRDSLRSRTVAVVQELKVVSPPARPVATAVCHSGARPSLPVVPMDSPMIRHHAPANPSGSALRTPNFRCCEVTNLQTSEVRFHLIRQVRFALRAAGLSQRGSGCCR